MTLRFNVLGVPAPQGSKTPWGSEANPRTQPWRDSVAWQARDAMNGMPPMLGPLEMFIVFKMPRPKAHYGTGGKALVLKTSAPRYCGKKPDIDKLLRAVCDAMTTAGVWKDDSQLAIVRAAKEYCDPGEQPGIGVSVGAGSAQQLGRVA